MEKLTHYVNGEQIEGTSGRYADVYNPATGEVQYQCPLASKSEVEAIIAKAEAAQPAWAAVNPQRRARVMMKFVDLLNRDMDKLAEVLIFERLGLRVPFCIRAHQPCYIFTGMNL